LVAAATGGTTPYAFLWDDTAGTVNDTLFNVCVDTFVVTVTDTNGCFASDTVVLTPLITVNANAGLDQQICQNDTLVLISDTLGSTFQWFLDTTLTVIGTDDTLTTVPGFTGPHTYILVVGDSICSDTDSVAVYIVPVAVNACCNQTIALGECVDLIGTVTNGVTFDWTPAATLDDPSSATPEACPDESTTYTLTAINDSGCVGTDSVFIQVEPDIPDGFTPQGDGFNDVWEIALLNNYPNAEVQVYNRWGQLVFDSPEGDMYAVKFDGTYNGKDLPVGTYYFVINLNDGITEPITGPITIMR
jgi:gliding motility-associated-like protein